MKKYAFGCLTALLICLHCPPAIHAFDFHQTESASVHGQILELGTRAPVCGAVVQVVGTTVCAESDLHGKFRITASAGDVNLKFMAIGFAPVNQSLKLSPGQDLQLNLFMNRVNFTSAAFVVRGKKEKPQVIATTLSRSEIKQIPGTSGDALRAVQNLPGIAVANDFSGHLAVQGGGPNDNLYLLDNIPWPFPFHFGGALSTVNTDLLSVVDLNSAGFGARWGNVMGAVLDAKTRPGQKDCLHTSFDVNMVTAQALIEGPLGIGDASFTLSGRRSYFDIFFGNLFGETYTAFPYFWDVGGSIDVSLNPSNRFHVMALGNDDILGLTVKTEDAYDPALSGEFRLDNRSFTGGCSWTNTSLPGLTSILTPYYYRTHVSESLGKGLDVNDRRDVYGIKEEAEWKAGTWLIGNHAIGFGISAEIVDFHTHVFTYRNDDNGVRTEPIAATVTSWSSNRNAYVQDRIQINPAWTVSAGVHYAKSDAVTAAVIMPRFSLEWQYDPRTLWKAAWGVYSQFPGILEMNSDLGNPGLSANLSEHWVLGLEKKFSREFSGRINAYYKYFLDLAVPDPASQNYVNAGLGTAKGIEVLLRGNWGERFFGWVSYACSRSERINPPASEWSAYQYDQPHILNLVASYHVTPPWSVGAKLHYHSGPLVKNLLGRYQNPSGVWQPVFSQTFDRRLEDYLRLDLRTDYTWRFEGWRLTAYLEVLNVFNRSNPAGVQYSPDYTETKVINNLPRVPYCGVEAKF